MSHRQMRPKQSFLIFKPSSRFGIKLNKPLLSCRSLRWRRQDSNASNGREQLEVDSCYFFQHRSANKNLCRVHKKNKTGTRRWEEQKCRLEDVSEKKGLAKRWRNQSGQKLQGGDEWKPAEGKQVGNNDRTFPLKKSKAPQSFKPVREHHLLSKTLFNMQFHYSAPFI